MRVAVDRSPTREEALADYRYVDSHDEVLEAFQMTEHTVFADGTWPPWLRMQQGKNDINCVYRMAGAPQDMFINMNGTEGQLGYNAWILRGPDDALSVMGEFEFRAAFTKVVPVPDKPPMVATDGQTDESFYDGLDDATKEKFNIKDPRDRKASPEAVAHLAAVESSAEAPAPSEYPLVVDMHQDEIKILRQQMATAIGLLQGGQSKAAKKATQILQIGLETADSGGLQWCNCAPGQCDKSTEWGCRESSPLL